MFVVDIGGLSPNPLSTMPLYCNVVYCTYVFFFIDVMVVSVFFGNYHFVCITIIILSICHSVIILYKYLYVSDKLLA